MLWFPGTSSNSQVLDGAYVLGCHVPQQFPVFNFLIGWEPLFSGAAVYLLHHNNEADAG
jgi:hypothetical protein